MKRYNVVKTINGLQSGETLESFATIEEARHELANQLMWLAEKYDDYSYFATAEDAEAEIADIDTAEIRQSWGDDRVDSYIAKLRVGIESGTPFLADHTYIGEGFGSVITTKYDRFCFDNYVVAIEVEVTCEPFEPGTLYPVHTCDEQGNNKWVDYADGSLLEGLSYLSNFCDLDISTQDRILDNTKENDREAIINGQVWANDDRTVYAIYYGD